MGINQIFEFVNKELLNLILNIALLSAFISVVSINGTQAIKITFEKVYSSGKKLNKIFPWFINTGTIIILSFFIVLIFQQKKSMVSILGYSVIVSIVSWVISIIGYNSIMKAIYYLIETGLNKIKELKILSELDVYEANMNVAKAKILNREFITEVELNI